MRPRARRHPAASDDLIRFPQQHIGPRAGKCLTEESRNHRRQDGRLGDQRTAREHVDDLLKFLRESYSSNKTSAPSRRRNHGENPGRGIRGEIVGAWPLLYSRGPSCMVFFQLSVNDLETVA